jgi:hypothetical protein
MSLLLKVKGCAFLGILKEYDKKAGLSKNLAYAVLSRVAAVEFSPVFAWLGGSQG